jgi:hypothetical protein
MHERRVTDPRSSTSTSTSTSTQARSDLETALESFGRRHRWSGTAALGVLLACSCSAGPRQVTERPSPLAPEASAAAAPSVDGARFARAGPWNDAARGDPQAIARLAELHPAAELVGVIRHDRARRATALAAVAQTEDAAVAAGDLARLARGDVDRRAMLEGLVAIARRPPSQSEPLAPSSMRSCIDTLEALSRDAAVARQDRALAVSALRAFARSGYLDAERITSELDD